MKYSGSGIEQYAQAMLQYKDQYKRAFLGQLAIIRSARSIGRRTAASGGHT